MSGEDTSFRSRIEETQASQDSPVSRKLLQQDIPAVLASSRKYTFRKTPTVPSATEEDVFPECISGAFRFPVPLRAQKKPRDIAIPRLSVKRRLPTLPLVRSTIGVAKLNFSVRNGKRWNLRAIVTLISLCCHDLQASNPSTRLNVYIILTMSFPSARRG